MIKKGKVIQIILNKKIDNISLFFAPTAFITPISHVLSITDVYIVFAIPTPPTINEIAAIPITIKLEKQTAKFSISKTSSETFYNVKYKDRGRLTSCSVSSCQNELGSSIKVIGISRSPTLVCMCVYIEQEGITGKFINDRSIDYSVSINVDGNIQDLTRDQNELSFNNNKIKVSGFGSLNNFDEINAPTSWYALFTNSKYSKLISTSAYNSQENNFKEFKSCMGYSTSASFWDVAKSPLSYLLSSIKSVGSVSTCVNNYRNKVNSYLFDQMDSYKSSKVSYYADSSDIYFEGDNLVINLKTPSVYPTFTIEMEAESVGIIKLKGKPKCENPKDVTINSGTSLTEMIRVTNIGEADGSFSGSVSCNGEVSGTISESYFEKGETKDMRISISASNTNQGTFNSNCVYTIKDRGSGETTTCSNTINVKYQSGIVCTPPGSFSCEGDNLMKCSSEGTEKLLEKVCPSGCLNNYCVGEIKNDTTSSTDCKSCSQWLMNIFKSKEKECSSTSAFKPDVKWYNPFSWTTWTSVKLLDLTGLTSQKYICPLYFLLLFVL